MKNKIENIFNASVIFEASIAVRDYSYLIIYGKHINGYYCCVPGWNWGCEMADPDSVAYNIDKLVACGATNEVAQALAEAINTITKNLNLKGESSMEKKKDDNELIPKTELSEDGQVINFSIKVSDLALLIKNSPEYCEQYVKRGKEAEFI